MRYFVTGATGFIGKRLVKKLLASPDSTVWFLLRDSSRAKLPALLAYWGADGARAIPVSGDVLSDGLGVNATDRAMLAGQIDHFFHLAAIYDLRAGRDEQVATNVEGTRRAVALAAELGARHFHHMSSVAAAGMYPGVFREDMFDEAEHLEHPYFATKHAAEGIVRASRGVPWRVYRPGLVVGDSHTGEADKADGPYYFFKLIQRVRALVPAWVPVIGIEGGRINIVPVDYVVDALVHIAHLDGHDCECFHLTDPAPKRVGEVLNLFARAAHAPPMALTINAALLDLVPGWLRKSVGALPLVHLLSRIGVYEKIRAWLEEGAPGPGKPDHRHASPAVRPT